MTIAPSDPPRENRPWRLKDRPDASLQRSRTQMNPKMTTLGLAVVAAALLLPAAAALAAAGNTPEPAPTCAEVSPQAVVCHTAEPNASTNGGVTVAPKAGATVSGDEFSHTINTPNGLPNYTIQQSEYDTGDATGDTPVDVDQTGVLTGIEGADDVANDEPGGACALSDGSGNCIHPEAGNIRVLGADGDAGVVADGVTVAAADCEFIVLPSDGDTDKMIPGCDVDSDLVPMVTDLLDQLLQKG